MSKTEANSWETASVTPIPPGIDVLIKIRDGEHDGEEVLLPALVVLHQTLFGEESITERIVLGVLDVNTAEIMAAEPDEVVTVMSDWFDGGDEGDGDEASNGSGLGFKLEQSD